METTTVSTKGQVVIPKEIRDRKNMGPGVKLIVQETPNGVFLIRVPKDSLKALEGMLEGSNIRPEDVKKLRMEDRSYEVNPS